MITIGHGAGGLLTKRLIEDHFIPKFDNPALLDLKDSAVLGDIAITTDAYVVTPRFFQGGNIGRVAVAGTVNDLAMVGAIPFGLTASFILEEGFSIAELDRIVDAMAATAREANVHIVSGDTKVVPRGACDGMFITTSGVGRMVPGFFPDPKRIEASDAVIVSGTIADHGMAVMAARQSLSISGDLQSDTAPIACLVDLLRESGVDVHALRDPTRGGAAATLNEMAESAHASIVIDETLLPVRPSVRMACELLGIDPLHVANEGKLIALVGGQDADRAVEILRSHPLGKDAVCIGEVEPGKSRLILKTALGTRRVIRLPEGEILPRIC
jgi:hydrogenase expression/formation protein HypE